MYALFFIMYRYKEISAASGDDHTTSHFVVRWLGTYSKWPLDLKLQALDKLVKL